MPIKKRAGTEYIPASRGWRRGDLVVSAGTATVILWVLLDGTGRVEDDATDEWVEYNTYSVDTVVVVNAGSRDIKIEATGDAEFSYVSARG